jgi:hypothetical protein
VNLKFAAFKAPEGRKTPREPPPGARQVERPALRQALPPLGDPFSVIHGDCYLDIAYPPVAAHFHTSCKEGLMTVFCNEGRWDTSNVIFEAGTILAYSKTDKRPQMRHIDYGLGILRASTLLAHRGDKVFGSGEPLWLAGREGTARRLRGPRRFYEIATTAGMAETDAYLRAQQSA